MGIRGLAGVPALGLKGVLGCPDDDAERSQDDEKEAGTCDANPDDGCAAEIPGMGVVNGCKS